MISMQGRTAVIFGVANKRSIAWAIAQKLQQAGANIVITYQNERLAQEAAGLIDKGNRLGQAAEPGQQNSIDRKTDHDRFLPRHHLLPNGHYIAVLPHLWWLALREMQVRSGSFDDDCEKLIDGRHP